jgi:hypothetical protein
MIWIIVIVVLLAVIGWYVVTRRGRPDKPADASYVCDVCGHRDCNCRRVDPESRE